MDEWGARQIMVAVKHQRSMSAKTMNSAPEISRPSSSLRNVPWKPFCQEFSSLSW
jgi:hypothetical protein